MAGKIVKKQEIFLAAGDMTGMHSCNHRSAPPNTHLAAAQPSRTVGVTWC